MPDPTSISWWFAQCGPSGIGLLLLWRGAVWIRPHAQKILEKCPQLLAGHISLMATMEEQMKLGATMLRKVSDTQDEHGVKLAQLHKRLIPIEQ